MAAVTDRKIDRIPYGILLVLATVQLAFNLYWTGVEVLGRLGLWPHDWVWFDLETFLANESLASQLIFAGFILLYLLGYALIVARSRLAGWVLLAAFFVGRLDWVMLAFSDQMAGSWMMLAEVGAQLTMLLLCWGLSYRGYFR